MSTPATNRWEIIPSTGSHFCVLDGLRGMAILMVVIFHTFYTNPTNGRITEFIGNLIRSGWIGVPIFFVLSGFLISYPFFLKRNDDTHFWYPRGYFLRRAAKILPPFYLSIVLFCLFYWVRFHDETYVHAAWRWAIGLESYARPIAEFNLSYWSLMVEAHFYVLLPLMFFLTRGLTVRNTTMVILCILLIIPLLLREIRWPTGVASLPQTQTGLDTRFFIERFPLCLLDYFAFGVAFAGLYVVLKPRLAECKKLASLGWLGVITLISTLCFWAYACKEYNVQVHAQRWSIETFKYLPALSGFLLLFFVFNPSGFGTRIFSYAPLRFIGIISYEWFLFHGPIVAWFRDMFGQTQGSLGLYACKTVLPLAVTFGFSVLVYRFFSLPILHRVREHLSVRQNLISKSDIPVHRQQP